MFLADKLNKGGSLAVAPDPQFNYVTMLLHGDGTNGAQNNTFLDSSSNNFTITRNGNTTQGSFSPYGNNWSVAFPNIPTMLTVQNSTPLNLSGGAYTIEGWINPLGIYSSSGGAYGLSGYNTIVGKRDTATAWEVYLRTSTGVLSFYNGSNYESSTTPTAGVWNHFAAVYDGTNISLYLNGSRVYGPTAMTNSDTTASISIGNYSGGGTNEQYRGSLSNLRITKGGALYTGSTYTIPTATLTTTVSSGTVSLLTCQSNRFIDNSVNNANITINDGVTTSLGTGNPTIQRFNPFGTSTAYSTSVIGGSGYFDGSGDYLQVGPNAAFSLGTGNFTIEGWFYAAASPSYWTTVISLALSTSQGHEIRIGYGGLAATGLFGFLYPDPTNNTDLFSAVSSNPSLNTWYHFALVRNGTNMVLYLNGTSVATASSVGFNHDGTNVYVGANPYPDPKWNGYISNVRVVKGTAVYTTTFTPPTAPLTAISGTSLLCNMTNGAIYDNAMMNDLETVGNAQISTSVVKYGTGSLKFNGTTDYLLAPYNLSFALEACDFTIEAWVYRNATGAENCLVASRDISSFGGFGFRINSTNTLQFYYTAVNSVISTGTIAATTWTHVAVTRSGTTVRLFINGTLDGSATFSDGIVVPSLLKIGVDNGLTGGFMNGYIDDLRITKGYARYTATFTPPTAAFPNTGPT